MGAVKEFLIEICRHLRVPIENFEDAWEVTWHLLQCTSTCFRGQQGTVEMIWY